MLSCVCTTASLNAQQVADSSNLYDMDLSALMNMDVSTVSKKSQSMSEAPAIVSVITAEQMEQFGAESLTELMSFIPGFTVQDSYWKRSLVTSRGLKQSNYNDKILMLINGVPTYDGAFLEYFLDVMPIVSVKRVEIIRGPGSTLYGTNAFAAVINVITKDGDNEGLHLQAGGNFDKANYGANYTKKLGKFLVNAGTTYTQDDGYKKYSIADNAGKNSDMLFVFNNLNLFGGVKYKNEKLGDIDVQAGYLNQEWTKFGPMPRHIYGSNGDVDKGGHTFHERMYTDLIWNKKFNDKLSSKIIAHYNKSNEYADLGRFGWDIYGKKLGVISMSDLDSNRSYYRNGGTVKSVEAQLAYNYSDLLNIIGGVSAEQRKTLNLADVYTSKDGNLLFGGSTLDSSNVKKDLTVNDIGGYLQADGRFKFGLGYVVGAHFSHLGLDGKTYVTPRAGLVYNVNKKLGFKLLYGEAFRGAGPQEQYYKIPILIYGKDAIHQVLSPEKISTLELATDITLNDKYKIRLNGFHNKVSGLINRRSASPAEVLIIDPSGKMTNTLIYDNSGKQTIYGAELEFMGYPTNYLSIWLNASYKDGFYKTLNSSKVDTTLDFIPYMEHLTFNAGFQLKVKKFTIAPNVQYVGERVGYLAADKYYKYPKTIGAYTLVNLVVSYKINEYATFTVIGKNLFDVTYYYPEELRKESVPVAGVTDLSKLNPVMLPGGEGRMLMGKITVKF